MTYRYALGKGQHVLEAPGRICIIDEHGNTIGEGFNRVAFEINEDQSVTMVRLPAPAEEGED